MDSSAESKARHACIHEERCQSSILYHAHHRHRHRHHHHFRVSLHCPSHSYMLHFNKNHAPTCPLFNSQSLYQNPLPNAPNLLPSDHGEAVPNNLMMPNDNVEMGEEEEEEDDEDPVFVLTDEWRDFFAKSEAKRRQEKKQAKKKGKK